MKLYYKNLKNLNELKKERKLLKQQARENSDFLPDLGSGADLLQQFTGSGLLSMLPGLIPSALPLSLLSKGKSKLLSLGGSLLKGYLKWMAIKYGVKIARNVVSSKKESRENKSHHKGNQST